jgi:hypothetical protein
MKIKLSSKLSSFLNLSTFLFLLSALSLLGTQKVQAEKYEEVSYEDLVNRLNKKKSQFTPNTMTGTLDTISLHAGTGLITSLTQIKADDETYSRQVNGFQISLGIDLFHPKWMVEGALRNFGNTNYQDETITLRENDLKAMFKDKMDEKAGYKVGTGLTTRYLKYQNQTSNLDFTETTPGWIFFGGVDIYMTSLVSVGIEGSYRQSMLTKNSDKGAFDLTLRLDTHF